MTYSAQELTTDDGRPVFLYQFLLNGTFFRFTNAMQAFDSVWLPATIDHSQPKVNRDQPGSQIELTFPMAENVSNPFTSLWAARSPEGACDVIIYRVHLSDAGLEQVRFFTGRVVSVAYTGDVTEVKFLVKALDILFEQEGPRRSWGSTCTHRLYDTRCSVVRTSYQSSAVVDSVSANGVTITFTADLPAASVSYLAGKLGVSGAPDTRLIVAVPAANQLTMQYPMTSVASGVSLNIEEGCARDITACKAFNNLINFGGFPYTPIKNPFTKEITKL